MNIKEFWNIFCSKKHILPSKLANKIGLPVFRTILTNLIFLLRRYKNCRPKFELEKELLKNGIIVIPNFLPNEEFYELKKEFNFIISDKDKINRYNRGSIEFENVKIQNEDFESFPALKKFSRNKQLIRLICVAEGKKLINQLSHIFIENTIFGDPSKDLDDNILYHTDVHFHSHKALYYMEDVNIENGPFTYCKNTHKNNLERLWFEFKRGQLNNSHEGDWRIQKNTKIKYFDNYFKKILNEKYKVVCPANTLIIANVHGFHKRAQGVTGLERPLIRIPIRNNPLEFLKI